jgi:hypothetical protein
MILGCDRQEEGDYQGSILTDSVHGLPHLLHGLILKSSLLFSGWWRRHYLQLLLLLISNSYGFLRLLSWLLEPDKEVRLQVTPLND